MPMLRPAAFGIVACMIVCQQTVAAEVDAADVAAARSLIDRIGAGGKAVVDAGGRLTEITISDGSAVTADDVALFGRLVDLRTLRILNCRGLDDAMVASLRGLAGLRSLALTNTAITDAAAETIATAFPELVELDLSSNTGLTGDAMKSIASLAALERLSLVQTRFNDLQTRRLKKMRSLRAVDLRGNMEAGDPTLAVMGGLPHLEAFKHRSTIVSDAGIERLAESRVLRSLLMQDFAISSESGRHLAAIPTLTSLEIFRCQGFGSDGVLALAPLDGLQRLTLRDLPEVDDSAIAVLGELPALERLYLHELPSVADTGLSRLAAAKGLKVLDIWSVPRMTDATIDVIVGLPEIEELSIRETGVTEVGLEKIAAMPKLTSLTFKNRQVSDAVAAQLAGRRWKKLDLGR